MAYNCCTRVVTYVRGYSKFLSSAQEKFCGIRCTCSSSSSSFFNLCGHNPWTNNCEAWKTKLLLLSLCNCWNNFYFTFFFLIRTTHIFDNTMEISFE